jgi:glycosyltransferase involved in cell wall biosynthesis
MIPGERRSVSQRRLKIAFVIDDLGYGGAQRQLSVLAEGLSEVAEPQVYCLSQTTHPFANIIRDGGARVVVLRRAHGFDLGRLHKLMREFSEQEIDVVQGFLDASNIYAYLAARLTHRPCAMFIQSDSARVRGFKNWCLRRALRGAGAAISNSKAGGRYLVDEVGLTPNRVAVIPNAVPLAREPGVVAAAPDKTTPVIGFIGRLVVLKRVDLLLDAFARVVRDAPEARLVILGDGPEGGALRERARRLGVDDRVEMPGTVDDVARRLAGFACLALPSSHEGLPNAALEALAQGVPVVANAAGDVRDLVLNGETGYLIDGDSPEALASALARALADEELRVRVRSKGPEMIRSNYSVEAAVERLIAIYTVLAGRTGR